MDEVAPNFDVASNITMDTESITKSIPIKTCCHNKTPCSHLTVLGSCFKIASIVNIQTKYEVQR
jgi:hypothetical protein